ncbi:hypothetical protein Gohar_015633 [Gossypium harknessii]|uniref:SET domain-containing protein n=1 Tax=Gossypium harknessii TaxID=34285 RepID=A0A7J9G0C9_9ROSI|nr:hypothetical protein [Gossypium harknessii]
MAEASRIFHSTLFPTLSLQLSQPCYNSHVYPSLSLKKAPRPVQCSVSTSETKSTSSNATQEVPWGCDIDSLENAEALQKWLSNSGLPPQKMAIDKVAVGERGLVALKNIRKGEKLLFVPPSLFITADSEWSSPEAGQVLKQYSVPDWPLLATYLITEASAQKSSRWCNYISALPRQPYSLLYCLSVLFQDTCRARQVS